MPWKVLGRKWHFVPKGFPSGGRSSGTSKCSRSWSSCWRRRPPRASFAWGNKQVVPLYVPDRKEPWAAVQTKKLDAVYLT